MHHIILNAAIFLCCYGIAMGHRYVQYRKHMKTSDHGRVGLISGLLNPATVDAVRDFAVHFMLYSGYVIPQH